MNEGSGRRGRASFSRDSGGLLPRGEPQQGTEGRASGRAEVKAARVTFLNRDGSVHLRQAGNWLFGAAEASPAV